MWQCVVCGGQFDRNLGRCVMESSIVWCGLCNVDHRYADLSAACRPYIADTIGIKPCGGKLVEVR